MCGRYNNLLKQPHGGQMRRRYHQDHPQLLFDGGGNFIDTSNNYQFEESEIRTGAWMKKRGSRDEIVLAIKYSTNSQGLPTAKGTGTSPD